MQRDTTKALNLVTLARNSTDEAQRIEYLDSAIAILRDIDARETRLEPHLRKAKKRAPKRKKVAR